VVSAALVLAGSACSSSGGHAAATTTTTTVAGDPAATVAAFCDAWQRLGVLEQATQGTSASDVAQVATHLAELQAVAQELSAKPPPSIEGSVRRYAAVIESVAGSFSQSNTDDTTLRQLSSADSDVLARYVAVHCAKR
jgi:hypothetical protein